MHSIDILYISLAVCAFLVVGILGYLAYHIVETIRSAKAMLDDMADVTNDVRGTKDFLKKDVLGRLFGIGRDFLDNHNGHQRKKITAYRTSH